MVSQPRLVLTDTYFDVTSVRCRSLSSCITFTLIVRMRSLASSLFHVAFLSDKSSTSVCIHFDRVVLTCSYFDVSSGRGRSSSYL